MRDRLALLAAVFRKEIVDALRDRRTLLMVLISSVLLGPAALVAISSLVASIEVSAEQRTVRIVGIEHAPTLRNFLERQTYRIESLTEVPRAASGRQPLAEPVVVVPPDFEAVLARGEAPRLEVVLDSTSQRSQAGARRVGGLLGAFGRERVALVLAWRGVAFELLEAVQVEERDVASAQGRATQVTAMLPFFVMMAVLYGALNAALDTTAGERERGSLEPLLMNPAPRWAIVAGKWAAVAAVAMLIALLSSLSFLPAQALLRSETLAAMFQYGPREAALFLAVLLPFAAGLSAVLMAVAIGCRTFKEAQASTTLVVLGVSLLPLVSVFNPGAEAPWQRWVPALAQNLLMTRVLRGEAMGPAEMLIPGGVSIALAALGIAYVARQLRHAAVR